MKLYSDYKSLCWQLCTASLSWLPQGRAHNDLYKIYYCFPPNKTKIFSATHKPQKSKYMLNLKRLSSVQSLFFSFFIFFLHITAKRIWLRPNSILYTQNNELIIMNKLLSTKIAYKFFLSTNTESQNWKLPEQNKN